MNFADFGQRFHHNLAKMFRQNSFLQMFTYIVKHMFVDEIEAFLAETLQDPDESMGWAGEWRLDLRIWLRKGD